MRPFPLKITLYQFVHTYISDSELSESIVGFALIQKAAKKLSRFQDERMKKQGSGRFTLFYFSCIPKQPVQLGQSNRRILFRHEKHHSTCSMYLKELLHALSYCMFVLDFNDAQNPAITFSTTPQFILFEVLGLCG